MKTIEALRPQWSRAPQALRQLLGAFELALAESRTVVLMGDPAKADFRAWVAVVHEKLGRRRVLLCSDGRTASAGWLASRRTKLAKMRLMDGRATAFVCNNFSCQPPAVGGAELKRLLGYI